MGAALTPARKPRSFGGATPLQRVIFITVLGWLVGVWPVSGTAASARWTQIAGPVFQHLGPDDGGATPVATALAEDGSGFLWVGTSDGLMRWDGYRFRAYRPNASDRGALPDIWISCLHTDARGRLWIGTISGGLARYDSDRDNFIVLPVGAGGISHLHVRSLADDGVGGLWVGTDGGLDHIDPNGAITHFHHDAKDPRSLPDDQIVSLLLDRHGTLWVGTRSGLVRRNRGTAGFTAVAMPAPKGATLTIYALFEDSSGRIWIGTAGFGAFLIPPGNTTARAIHATPALDTALIKDFAEPVPGEIWLGTYGEGIVALDTKTWQTHRLRAEPARPSSLINDTVRVLYRDHSGFVWVGTTAGLDRYDPEQTVTSLFGGVGGPGVSQVEVDSVMSAADGRIWVGLGTNGIDILDPVHGLVGALRPDRARPQSSLPVDAKVYAMAAATGTVYIGTTQGLYRTDSAGRRVTPLTVSKEHRDMIVSRLYDDGSTLWVGSADQGLWAFDPHLGEATRHYDEAQLTDQRVTVIAPAAGGGLWVGTYNGLNWLDTSSGKIERILADPHDPQSLSAPYVASLLTDARGRLWVATAGGGIDVLERHDATGRPRFRRLGTAQGLPNDNVDTLLADASGKIWASTDNGIAVIDPQTFGVRALRRAEGVSILTYWNDSGAVTSRGEVLFGGLGGLTVIRPDRLEPWTYRPSLVITDIRVGGKEFPAGRFNRSGNITPLAIQPDANRLAVEFAALDFSSPERNRYAYRLDGFDRHWIDVDSTHRLAEYTNLAPGGYVLQLRGTNRDGVWSDDTFALPIRVLPAWYQTLWFRVIEAIIAVLFAALAVQAWRVTLRRRQQELARQIAERTAELQQRTNELLETQRQLEQIAYIDALTLLPNRRMFSEALRKALSLADRRQARFALVLLDLDGLKRVNDTLGHDFGDALLVETAKRLKAVIRDSDFVARLGGDEFAILISEGYDKEGAELVCRRIVESFIVPVVYEGRQMNAGMSVGIAMYPDHGDNHAALVKSADLALYAAKRAGGERWLWYREKLEAETAS